MSKEIGVVKNVTQGSVKAVSLTGESRELKVGDIVYQGEKIVTESTDAKVVIAKADGKEISLIGKDSINLDQSVGENSQTTADITSLQKAILSGEGLAGLEETAAGGNQAGGNAGGDGVSLGAASFAQGGHYSNISANFNNLGDLGATFEAPVSSVGGGQSENLGDGAATDNVVPPQPLPQPPLPQPLPPQPLPQPNGIIKIPLSAHKGEDPSAELLPAFTTKIPSGYSVQKQGDGRSYLVPDDGVNEFTYNNGWYVSNDGQLAIGQDEAKKLAVTSNANEGNYPDDGTVAKIVAPNAQLNVFGSDINDEIVVDNAQINNVYGGVGADKISGINSAKLSNISGGSGDDVIDLNKTTITGMVVGNEGDDTINVDNGSKVAKSVYGNDGKDTITIDNNSVVSKNVFGNAGEDTIVVQGGAKVDGWVLGDTKTKNDMHEKQVNPLLDITDNGAGNDTIKISGAGTSVKYIGGGNGDDTITVEKGARVVLIQADEGDDTITVTGAGTFTSAVNGRGGDDTILVSDQATVEGIVGRWGNDDITVTGAGTTVTEYVQGNEDADTIRILDGATVNQYVSGGRGEDPNVYGGAQDSDKNTVIIKNATVKGDVEGSTRGGDSEIEISGSTINGKIVGSSDGTKASKLTIEDGSVDFSKVEKITNLELGGADKNLNITLTKDDIFRNNELKIDGEEGDKVTLTGGFTEVGSHDGYRTYAATGSTISVDIKEDVVVTL
ncbi:retention module-containing protein [Campylobacter concisus]|uniref:retention module-containing protein n=1 Tax=Campylobacter concisus TaxID=199 RepID=UPI00112FCFB2|nr:retention module-containing protein [Campylobacter concisus]